MWECLLSLHCILLCFVSVVLYSQNSFYLSVFPCIQYTGTDDWKFSASFKKKEYLDAGNRNFFRSIVYPVLSSTVGKPSTYWFCENFPEMASKLDNGNLKIIKVKTSRLVPYWSLTLRRINTHLTELLKTARKYSASGQTLKR